MKRKIAIYDCERHEYPDKSTLFRPDTKYPEYIFSELSAEKNYAYSSVREAFHLMGYDKENYGTSLWNPLKDFIHQGDNILIKPNLVMDVNFNNEAGTDCLYTHPSVVAPVIDYVILALNGKGNIVIGDAPMQECDFNSLIKKSGYDKLIDYYKHKGYNIDLVDFRELSSVIKDGVYYQTTRENHKGKIIDLGKESDFYGLDFELENKLRITNYDPRILPTHHHGEIQEYYISEYVLKSDVIINMPKPKTHRKAGVTIALKNFVGINVRKEFLPHHTKGSVYENGDEYLYSNKVHKLQSNLLDTRNKLRADKKYIAARIMQYMVRVCSISLKLMHNMYSEGSWYGNHTISRTINDLNKIILYADKQGIMRENIQRKLLIVADMIVSGEKEGPVNPSPKNVGIIAVGDDQVLFDESITLLMGFDSNKIPAINCAKSWNGKYRFYDPEDCAVFVSNIKLYNLISPHDLKKKDTLNYIPTAGWINHIEKV